MRWNERMMPPLERLAAKMLRSRDFGYLQTVADLMVGLNGPAWERLPDEDKLRYLAKMEMDFHPKGMGDSEYGFDPDYSAICELIGHEHTAVKRRL